MELPSRFEIDDEPWAEVEPSVPVRERRRRYPGRNGAGCATGRRPACGTPSTSGCSKRSNAAGAIEWSRAAVDGSRVRAFWAHDGPSPVDRSRTRSKDHLLVDATGSPLAVSLTGGTATTSPNSSQLLDALHARPVAGKPGRPRQKRDLVLADRGYDDNEYRRLLWQRGIKPVIARRNSKHGSGLGTTRWVVERGFAHLDDFRRLRTPLADYPPTSIAQIAEGELGGRRLIARRVRTLDRQGELLPPGR